VGNDKAESFLNQLNNVMADMFGEISVEYKRPKSKTKVVQMRKNND
jgi:phage gp16-like protein